MKKVFNFYFLIVVAVSAIVLVAVLFDLIGNKYGSIFNSIVNISILIGYSSLLFNISKKLIQYFYSKTLVLRMSFNWTSIIYCVIGIVFILSSRSLDLLWFGIPAELAFGVLFVVIGLIDFPRFIKFSVDSIVIYELPKRQIRYVDLLRFDYRNDMIVFETNELNYELKVLSVDLNQIDRIKYVINNSKINFD